MVEGGARVISSFLHSGFVDSLVITIAPTMVGEGGIGYGIKELVRKVSVLINLLHILNPVFVVPSAALYSLAPGWSRYRDGMEIAVGIVLRRHDSTNTNSLE